MKIKIAKAIMLSLLVLLAALVFGYSYSPIVAIPSESMKPTYEVGDLVVIKPETPEKISKGDIIVVNVPTEVQEQFSLPNSIIHRVVESNPHPDYVYTFTTKGDNNKENDPFLVTQKDLHGKAVYSIPYAGFLILYLHSVQGKLFLGFVLFLMVVKSIISYFKKKNENIQKQVSNYLLHSLQGDLEEMKIQFSLIQKKLDELNTKRDENNIGIQAAANVDNTETQEK